MARPALLFTLLLAVGLLLVGPGITAADDVPDDARKDYDKARSLFAKGDLKKAYSAISKGKAKSPDSVDFWHLYVRIWRGLEKKEATLWEKIISKAEAKHPGSVTFDMLRFRLADEAEKRIEHLQAALAKKPGDSALQLMIAKEHLGNDDEDIAEEILDQVLETEPANETALVIKGDLMIASGRSRSALAFAEETLAEHDLPGLHDLAARALILVAENDESAFEKARQAAEKAVAGRADATFVLTLATILDRTGKEEEAVALLTKHYEQSASPELGGRLGEMAFRTGDYDKAAKGLVVAAPRSRDAALALALSEARRGRAKQARDALNHLLRHGAAVREWAAGIEILLGDLKKARAHVEAGEGEWVTPALAFLAAAEGKPDAIVSAHGVDAKGGTRMGEEWLLQIAIARLNQKLGGKAGAARKLIREAGYAAAKAGTPGFTPPEMEEAVKVTCGEYMSRHVTYRRALNNEFFAPGEGSFAITFGDGFASSAAVVLGTSECPRDRQRSFRFNEQKKKMEGEEINPQVLQELMEGLMGGEEGDWAGAEAAFKEGAVAFVDGDLPTAELAFKAAVEKEPGWARAKLFEGIAQALAGKDGTALATEAVKTLPEDWEGRKAAILVQLLAGKDGKAEAKALGEMRESFSTRRFDEFWDEDDE